MESIDASHGDHFAFGDWQDLPESDSMLGETPPDDIVLPAVDSLAYAGFWVRFGARFIDMILIYAIAFITDIIGVFVIATAMRLTGVSSQAFVESLATPTLGAFVVAFFAAITYGALAEGIHGSTPGKMALGITVLSDDGSFCGFPSAIGRELAYFLDSLFFGAIAYSSMRRSRRCQRLGDRWAHTVVVRRSSLSTTQRRSPWRYVAACAAACLVYSALTFAALLLRI